MMEHERTDQTPLSAGRPWLLWDGDCAFCCRAVAWARARGADRHLRIRAYQDAPPPPMDDALRRRATRAVQVVSPDGRSLEAGRAALFVLERTGWGRFARGLARRPWIWVVEAVYRFVAMNRGRLSRLWSRDPRLCRDEDSAILGRETGGTTGRR